MENGWETITYPKPIKEEETRTLEKNCTKKLEHKRDSHIDHVAGEKVSDTFDPKAS